MSMTTVTPLVLVILLMAVSPLRGAPPAAGTSAVCDKRHSIIAFNDLRLIAQRLGRDPSRVILSGFIEDPEHDAKANCFFFAVCGEQALRWMREDDFMHTLAAHYRSTGELEILNSGKINFDPTSDKFIGRKELKPYDVIVFHGKKQDGSKFPIHAGILEDSTDGTVSTMISKLGPLGIFSTEIEVTLFYFHDMFMHNNEPEVWFVEIYRHNNNMS